jgi:predicted ester cyclase
MTDDISTLGRRFFESQDGRRGGPDPALCTPDYRAKINSRADADIDGHDEFARVLYTAFPDMTREFDEVIVTPEKQVVRFRLIGTHEGDFMSHPPTGKRIDCPCLAVLQIRDGKVARLDGIADIWSILLQIGAL